MKIATLFLALLTVSISANAQHESWVNYPYAKLVTSFEEDASSMYIGTKGGLIKIGKEDFVPQYLNKANSKLPSNMVEAMQIDRNGNIWVGTYDAGVAIIKNDDISILNTLNSNIPSNIINTLDIDREGNIWVGMGIAKNKGGMAVYQNNTFNYMGDVPGQGWGIVAMYCNKENGDIWYIGSHSVAQNVNGQFIDHSSEVQGYSNKLISSDKDGNIWVMSSNQVAYYDGTDWHKFNNFNTNFPTISNFNGMAKNPNGNMVFLKGNHLITFSNNDFSSIEIQDMGIEPKTYNFIKYSIEGHLIIADHETVNIMKSSSNTWQKFPVSELSFNNFAMKLLTAGENGEMYMVHRDKIVQYNNGQWQVLPISITPHNFNITGLKITNGTFYIPTTPRGLFVYKNGTLTNYTAENSGLIDNNLWEMAADKTGNLWFRTPSSGLVKFKDGIFSVYNESNSDIPHNKVSALATDARNNLWFVTDDKKLVKFDGDKTFTTYDFPQELQGRIWKLLIVDDEVYFSGSHFPLGMFNGHDYVIYYTGDSNFTGFRGKSLIEGNDGKIWMGAEKGLFSWDGSQYKIYDYDNSLLCSEMIEDLAFDIKGNLWISNGANYQTRGSMGVSILQFSNPASNFTKTPSNLKLQVYPNPTNDKFHITGSFNPQREYIVAVYDIIGKMVFNQKIKGLKLGDFEIPISSWEKGVYILNVRSSDEFHSTKVIVK